VEIAGQVTLSTNTYATTGVWGLCPVGEGANSLKLTTLYWCDHKFLRLYPSLSWNMLKSSKN